MNTMDIADWLLQIEKVAVLMNTEEYKLAMAKSTSTPYKMLKRMGNDLSWQEINWKLEVYSPIATEVHMAGDLHRKQPDETLQECIQNFTDLTEKAMGVDLANITNSLIIFLFINTFTTIIYKNVQEVQKQ